MKIANQVRPRVSQGEAPGADGQKAGATDEQKAEAPAKPLTLGAYLDRSNIHVDELAISGAKLREAARTLLRNKGFTSPSAADLSRAESEMSQAIAAGTWKEFTLQMRPPLVQIASGVEDKPAGVFYERIAYASTVLTDSVLKLSELQEQRLVGDFENGVTGMVLAATLISTDRRDDADFSRAYGDRAWRAFMRATMMLDAIPKGQLLERLDLALMTETNRLIHSPDEGAAAVMHRTMAAIERGFRWDKGGEIRTYPSFARLSWYGTEEVKNLEEAGVEVTTFVSRGDRVLARLKYAPPEEIRPRLQAIIDALKQTLTDPDADVIAAAARFQRRLVAVHPFADSNGRTSRALMNRILREYGYPPAIFESQNRDISCTQEAWTTEVKEGVARTKRYLDEVNIKGRSQYAYSVGVELTGARSEKPVIVDGMPFMVGRDGFLYDPTGRSWLAFGDDLVPLGQLEHMVFIRRLLTLPREQRQARLDAMTKVTRALHDKILADPKVGEGVRLRSDVSARRADADFSVDPAPEVGALLLELCRIDQERFDVVFDRNRSGRGTKASYVMSKYAQVDLELWYVEQAFVRQGDEVKARAVHRDRDTLFDLAKARLAEVGDAEKTASNPLGFAFHYEELEYETSPLRFDSLAQAIESEGDDTATVWRGDYAFVRLIGMGPDNSPDPRRLSARQMGRRRARNGQTTHIYNEIASLSNSAVGRPYLCMTSDLGLLRGSFADNVKGQVVPLDRFPSPISLRLLRWIEAGASTENAGSKVASPPTPTRGIKDVAGVPGTFVSFAIVDREAKKVEVNGHRKAFKVRVDKDSLLPGIFALGGTYETEQEMHGIERILPWRVRDAYEATTLARPVGKAAVAPPAAEAREAEEPKTSRSEGVPRGSSGGSRPGTPSAPPVSGG